MGERDVLRDWMVRLAGGLMLLVLAFGCKLPPPNLKPPEGPQELVKPPHLPRYENPEWREEALRDDRPKRNPLVTDDSFKGMPGGTPGAGGMGVGTPGGPR